MLEEDQIEGIKKQLIEQINSTFPEDKKQEAIQKIEVMNNEELEQFLIQNNLIKSDGSQPSGEGQKCIFCSIVFGDITSTKIAENENAIAILEINPLSKGHTLVIPKEHKQEISNETKEFAEQIKNLLKEKLSPKDIVLEQKEMFGHGAIDLIPVYGEEELKQRTQASPEELEELQKQLSGNTPTQEKPKENSTEEPSQEINEKNTWLPIRIP
jgi:histidine triad (HIT) family protein